MIWYCKLELVYRQNKEYQRWSCKKEKKICLFLLHMMNTDLNHLNLWTFLLSWIEKYLGFHFLEGFEKRFGTILNKGFSFPAYERGISSYQNTMILHQNTMILLPLQSWFWGNVSSSILGRVWGLLNVPFQYDFWSSLLLGFEMGRNHIGILWKPSRSK